MANKKRKAEPEPAPAPPEPVKKLKRSPRRRGAATPSKEETASTDAETETPNEEATSQSGSQHDTDDATSISSQDDDLQAKYSRRAIVNLQKLIDNVTAEIGLKKQEEESQEDKEESTDKEKETTEKETKVTESKKPEKKDTAKKKEMETPSKTLPHFDFKNINDDEVDTDPEVCSPPKLHKELAFLNQEMPILDTAPEMEPAIPMVTDSNSTTTQNGPSNNKAVDRTDADVDMDDEAPPLVVDEAVNEAAKQVEEDDESTAIPHLPQHLQELSKQFEEELEESKKKQEQCEPEPEPEPAVSPLKISAIVSLAPPKEQQQPAEPTPPEPVSSSTSATPPPLPTPAETAEPMDMPSSISEAEISNTTSKALSALEAIKENIDALNQANAAHKKAMASPMIEIKKEPLMESREEQPKSSLQQILPAPDSTKPLLAVIPTESIKPLGLAAGLLTSMATQSVAHVAQSAITTSSSASGPTVSTSTVRGKYHLKIIHISFLFEENILPMILQVCVVNIC